MFFHLVVACCLYNTRFTLQLYYDAQKATESIALLRTKFIGINLFYFRPFISRCLWVRFKGDCGRAFASQSYRVFFYFILFFDIFFATFTTAQCENFPRFMCNVSCTVSQERTEEKIKIKFWLKWNECYNWCWNEKDVGSVCGRVLFIFILTIRRISFGKRKEKKKGF